MSCSCSHPSLPVPQNPLRRLCRAQVRRIEIQRVAKVLRCREVARLDNPIHLVNRGESS